eukprot:2640707-Amphidinium_carterae.1
MFIRVFVSSAGKVGLEGHAHEPLPPQQPSVTHFQRRARRQTQASYKTVLASLPRITRPTEA